MRPSSASRTFYSSSTPTAKTTRTPSPNGSLNPDTDSEQTVEAPTALSALETTNCAALYPFRWSNLPRRPCEMDS